MELISPSSSAPAVNVFRQNVNFFGKSIPLKTTFTFGTAQQNSSSDNSNVGKRNPEVNTTWTPYNEDMASPVNQGETFITWPKQIAQKPAEMVASGFYYTGRGDVVQCFYCGICLKHWTPQMLQNLNMQNMHHNVNTSKCFVVTSKQQHKTLIS